MCTVATGHPCCAPCLPDSYAQKMTRDRIARVAVPSTELIPVSHLALHLRPAVRAARAMLAVLPALLVSGIAAAATIQVPSGQPTLQAAVAAASSGDVILIA